MENLKTRIQSYWDNQSSLNFSSNKDLKDEITLINNIVSNPHKHFHNKNTIFLYSFLILLYAELIIRYTGISSIITKIFIATPFLLIPLIYLFLANRLSKESKIYE